MQKDLLKLALTGLAAGVCISAQGSRGDEIAMAKCSRTPTAVEEQNSNDRMMDNRYEEMDEDEMNENPTYNPQSDTCASSCGHQGDQSSLDAPRLRNYMETKRLSAAKAAMKEESGQSMDK